MGFHDTRTMKMQGTYRFKYSLFTVSIDDSVFSLPPPFPLFPGENSKTASSRQAMDRFLYFYQL
jgi:hypothetical protein